jgi:hypothetical protein
VAIGSDDVVDAGLLANDLGNRSAFIDNVFS